MSRVGKQPIPLPSGVTVAVNRNQVTAKGPKGSLERSLHPAIEVQVGEREVICHRPTDSRQHRSLHGLTRSLVANLITGVSTGYKKELELVGVGYRAQKQGDDLLLSLGFSHPIKVALPAGIGAEISAPTQFAITGSDKELVGQVAADIRKLRRPEPYKGKGVLYKGEIVRRKAGKAGKGSK
ncbi:MAG: 50S ribosomal protein L6 [Candidatus Dormibacteraceae bacterium]